MNDRDNLDMLLNAALNARAWFEGNVEAALAEIEHHAKLAQRVARLRAAIQAALPVFPSQQEIAQVAASATPSVVRDTFRVAPGSGIPEGLKSVEWSAFEPCYLTLRFHTAEAANAYNEYVRHGWNTAAEHGLTDPWPRRPHSMT